MTQSCLRWSVLSVMLVGLLACSEDGGSAEVLDPDSESQDTVAADAGGSDVEAPDTDASADATDAGATDDGGTIDDGDTEDVVELENSCTAVVVTDFFEDATDVGDCTSAAGLQIADSLMNLSTVSIDNNGETMVPCVEVRCDATHAYLIGNGLPHYDFVQTTPNELAEDVNVYRIPLEASVPGGVVADTIEGLNGCVDAYDAFVSGTPTANEPAGLCADAGGFLSETLDTGSATYGKIPCLGFFGSTISGVNINGPNEATIPDPWGDPAFSYPDTAIAGGNALDFCGGHTGGNMHYHGVWPPCFERDDNGAPALGYADAVNDWTQEAMVSPSCEQESPIVGWSVDGYPIKGPCVCTERDASGACTDVRAARSSWTYDGLSAHSDAPDTSLQLENVACDSDDECCADGDADCALRCNFVLNRSGENTEVAKVCTVLDYSWCSSAFQDRSSRLLDSDGLVYLDRCNGFDGPDGFAYHTTGTFPYVQACYRGVPAEQAALGGVGPGGGGPGGGGPGGGGPGGGGPGGEQ